MSLEISQVREAASEARQAALENATAASAYAQSLLEEDACKPGLIMAAASVATAWAQISLAAHNVATEPVNHR